MCSLKCILFAAPNLHLRFDFWWWCVSSLRSPVLSNPAVLARESPIDKLRISKAQYIQITSIESSVSATSHTTGELGEIMRDVNRTYPTHELFKGPKRGEKLLSRVLKAVVTALPDVGYCQGMNFVAGCLLINRIYIGGDVEVGMGFTSD